MRILIISPTQSGIGGIAQHVQGLQKFLQKNSHHVEIISSDNTFTLPIKGLKNPSFMVSSYFKSKFKKNQDIVHAHNIPSAKAMKNAKGKKILTLHGIFSEQIDMLHGKTLSKISKNHEKNALNWADLITVVSKEAQQYYEKLGFNPFHIPNAIDIDTLEKSENKIYEKQIIYVGRLSKEKGILELLLIAKKLPKNINLIIVGNGPEEENVKIASRQENIHYFGYLPSKQTIPLIRGSEILIQPSLIEGISTSILEAMACKTVVVATEIGGNKEVLSDHNTGILIQNHSEILDTLNELYSNSQLRKLLVENAFTEVQKYDWKNIGKQYLELYNSFL